MPWKETTVVSIREEFVLKALEPRTNLAAVCREFGVSRKTGYKWLERYKSGGVLALRDLSRRPRTSPLGASPEVIVDLVAIRNAHPRWGALKLIWALEQSGALQLFERLFGLHGLAQRILTDNGTPFVAPSSRFGLT